MDATGRTSCSSFIAHKNIVQRAYEHKQSGCARNMVSGTCLQYTLSLVCVNLQQSHLLEHILTHDHNGSDKQQLSDRAHMELLLCTWHFGTSSRMSQPQVRWWVCSELSSLLCSTLSSTACEPRMVSRRRRFEALQRFSYDITTDWLITPEPYMSPSNSVNCSLRVIVWNPTAQTVLLAFSCRSTAVRSALLSTMSSCAQTPIPASASHTCPCQITSTTSAMTPYILLHHQWLCTRQHNHTHDVGALARSAPHEWLISSWKIHTLQQCVHQYQHRWRSIKHKTKKVPAQKMHHRHACTCFRLNETTI